MGHTYADTTINPAGTVRDYCSCGFSVRYHVADLHARRTAEAAMRQHLES